MVLTPNQALTFFTVESFGELNLNVFKTLSTDMKFESLTIKIQELLTNLMKIYIETYLFHDFKITK